MEICPQFFRFLHLRGQPPKRSGSCVETIPVSACRGPRFGGGLQNPRSAKEVPVSFAQADDFGQEKTFFVTSTVDFFLRHLWPTPKLCMTNHDETVPYNSLPAHRTSQNAQGNSWASASTCRNQLARAGRSKSRSRKPVLLLGQDSMTMFKSTALR